MNIAFYAPLKPPTSLVPSGDRLIARLLIQALEGGGHRVSLASRFRAFDAAGDAKRQKRLEHIGAKLAMRLLRRIEKTPHERPDLWFTYHLYHKAPDWIGPRIARELGIPYVVAEASFAPKQAGGRWAGGHESVARTLGRADLIIALNRADIPCITPLVDAPDKLIRLKPFLDCSWWRIPARPCPHCRDALVKSQGICSNTPLLLSVAMMRPGGKLASYRLLARALLKLTDRPWHLLIAGDGPARDEVRAAFAPIESRVTWLGECNFSQLAEIYAACDLFVWPAINEAIGMCFLEAQAAGLPVVGGNGGGVPDVIRNGKSGVLARYGDADDFAAHTGALLENAAKRKAMGEYAARYVQREHELAAAGKALCRALEGVAT